MTRTLVIPNDFHPREYQREAMAARDGGTKRSVWVWHRRAGKDLTALHQDCKDAHRRVGVYWHIFPTAEQGRKAISEGFTKSGERIMEQVFPSAIRKSPRNWTSNGEMVVTPPPRRATQHRRAQLRLGLLRFWTNLHMHA